MSNNHSKKGFNRVIALFGAALLIVCALYVPMIATAAGNSNSVEIKDNEAFVFDFSTFATGAENTAAATAENGVGYYGWGWGTKKYTEGETSNTVLQAANASGMYWGTGGGLRLHSRLADDKLGIYALEPNTRYVVSFKIRVMSSPVTVSGSKETNKSYTNLVYDVSFDPKADGQQSNYVNRPGTTAKKIYESLIDSNVFTLYDTNGNGTTYACSDNWYTATYFITTPAEFKKDNALAFYTTNYHGTNVEFDDVSVTKVGADSGIILLKDEYSATDELFFGKEGEKIDLNAKDIADRAKDPSHTFEGWYADAGRTEKITEVTFSKTEDKTVYSRWNAPVTVTFKNTLDGTESKVTGKAGDKFTYPEDPTDPDGKVWFMGWYKDEGCTVAHLVPQFGYADETLYTYWKAEVPGITQDFENYTKDSYKVAVDKNGQSYKDNRLIFAPTMTKQSEITYDNSGYAVKYRWNPVQVTDKNDYNYYDTSRVTAKDNYFWLGKGLENNTVYNVTFKYLAEKAPAPVSFYMVTGAEINAWAGCRQYDTLKDVTLELDGKWHEVTMQFTTNYNGDANNSVFLGISNTQNIESIVYFDDVKVEAFAQPYESVITLNTNIDGEVINFKGKRGEKIEWPEMTHPDNAPFNGYYLDKNYTEKYESEVFERLPVTLYAQWLSYSGFTQDFENYTADQWQEQIITKNNNTPDDPSDDYTLTYKNNYLIFYTTMSKQSEVVNSGNNAIKFHWNTDPSTDKDVSKDGGKNGKNPESYEHSRYSADDNLIYLGKGLENNQYYDVTFKYKVEKGAQDVTFYMLTGNPTNSWGGRATYRAPEAVSLKKTDGWVEYTFSFTTGSIGGNNAAFLGVKLSKHDDVIMYFDDVKVKSLANSAEVVMFLETGTSLGKVNHVGKRGEALNLPTITHADGAKFLGWYLDASCTTPFEGDVYPVSNTVLYAKWAPYAMTFREYPYGGGAGPYSDPNISVVHQKGIGNGDDYAMRFYVNRKTDNTSGAGTSQAIQIAAGIENGALYRVKFDYKSSSIQSSAASLAVVTAYPQNIWVSPAYNKYSHTNITLPQGGTNGWQSAEFIIRANVKTDGYHNGNALFLRYTANIYKAGDKIDALIDNVLVEKIEAPYVYFDTQTASGGIMVTGEAGDKIVVPKELPSRVGYTFEGWYNEPECLTKFTLDTFEADAIVYAYAKWKEASTFVYSFENFSRTETEGWSLSNGRLATDVRKSGKKSLHFPNLPVDQRRNSISIYAIEDGGEFFQLEPNSGYIVLVNYYIKEAGNTNLSMSFLASQYNNFYVGRNTQKTELCGASTVTPKMGKDQKGKWIQKGFALDTSHITDEAGNISHSELYAYFVGGEGWDIYIDDVTIIPVPKGKKGVVFDTEGVKGCPNYLIGKTGQDYSSKVPETLTKEGMYFKGYYTKGLDGLFSVKTRGNMIFGDKTETIYGRFIDFEVVENFDEGFYDKAYAEKLVYTIHDFDYEVYDSEKEGNSKDNVTSGRYSLHRKGNSMFNENSVVLTLGTQIAEGERYTVSFKVKVGKHFHTDGAIKIVSSRDYRYAWTTTGDYYPVVPIAEIADGQWHEVSYTFNSVEAFACVQTPGYVELFMDDFKFTLSNDTPLSEPKPYVEYVATERDANGNVLKIDITAVDVTTIIDKSIGVKPTYIDWNKIYMIGGISLGGIAIIVAAIIVLVKIKKKKKAKV